MAWWLSFMDMDEGGEGKVAGESTNTPSVNRCTFLMFPEC